MRCRACRERRRWFRRLCDECAQLLAVFNAHRGADMGAMLDAFMAVGARREAVERFLAADPDGHGTIRDRIAADMTNDLLAAFGQTARQSVGEVKRLRERGLWGAFDRRPPQ